MKGNRPNFQDIHSFKEFSRYYWYREELSRICQSLGLEYRGTKQELNHIIEQYFQGNRIEKSSRKSNKTQTEPVTLRTPLLACGFAFNQTFREYFAAVTGVHPFKFTANMATAWRKVKAEQDVDFTIQDMLKVYYGESDYARYDNSACQWNQFLKDFCLDERSDYYTDKLKVAAILWREVRDSKGEKVYATELLDQYGSKIAGYRKQEAQR